jgi:hypothetical protein
MFEGENQDRALTHAKQVKDETANSGPEDPMVFKRERSDSKRADESLNREHSSQKHPLPLWLISKAWQLSLLIIVIGLVIIASLILLLLEPASAASKEAIDLIQIIISWPVVIIIALFLLYKPLSQFFEFLGQNFQTVKISVLQFALEVSRPSAREFIPDWSDTFTGVDLRLAAANDIISSTPSLFEQFKDKESLDYVLIDIGDGKRWLTSRLFIFVVMLERMRGLRCLVFVETTSDAYQRFLGTASPSEMRWKLTMLYPWLEPAFDQALYLVQYFPNVLDPPQLLQVQVPSLPKAPSSIRSVNGAVEPLVAKSIVRAFLNDPTIQLINQPVQDDSNWVEISRPNKPPFWEHASWIDRTWIYKQGDVINRKTIRKSSPDDSPTEQTKAILRGHGAFISLVNEEKQFEDLVDRHNLLENVVTNLRKEFDDKT